MRWCSYVSNGRHRILIYLEDPPLCSIYSPSFQCAINSDHYIAEFRCSYPFTAPSEALARGLVDSFVLWRWTKGHCSSHSTYHEASQGSACTTSTESTFDLPEHFCSRVAHLPPRQSLPCRQPMMREVMTSFPLLSFISPACRNIA